MKLRERKWNTCEACKQRTTVAQEESFGCDQCKRPIDDALNSGNSRHHDYLQVQVFHEGGKETEEFHLCSWICVFKFLPKIKSNYFVTLPYLMYDARWPGTTAKDFFAALRKAKS